MKRWFHLRPKSEAGGAAASLRKVALPASNGRRQMRAGWVALLLGAAHVLVAAQPAHELVSHPTLKNGLVAWYAFDGDIADAPGNHPARVAAGTPVFGPDRFGRPRGALVFSGAEALAVSGIDLGQSSFTLQFWTFRPRHWFLGQGTRADHHGLHIGVEEQGLRCDYWGDDLLAPLAPGNGWNHWVITHDRATGVKSIWRDGVCVASKVTAPYVGRGDFIIGRHFLGGGYYTGGLDDLAIWTRALTREEIAALYDDGAGLIYRAVGVERRGD